MASTAAVDSATPALPMRKILTPTDLTAFHDSPVYNDFVAFIDALNDSVRGITSRTECTLSPVNTIYTIYILSIVLLTYPYNVDAGSTAAYASPAGCMVR